MSTTSPDRPGDATRSTNPPQPSATGRNSSYDYWAALLALVLVSVGFGAISPSLADILDELVVTASVGSLLVSAFGAGRLIGGFPAGIVVGRFGPGRVILLGCGVCIVGSVIAWLAPVFPVLVIGRLIQGIGLGIVPAGVLAGIMAGAKAERAGGSMALYQSALSLGGALGPAVGGPLSELYDWRAALLFCVVAGVVALGLAVPMAGRSSSISNKPAQPRDRLSWAAVVAITVVLLPHLATFLYRMSVSQLALPLYATGPGGLDPMTAGLMLGAQGVMTLAILAPAGWATNRFGVQPVVAVALGITSLAVLSMPLVPVPYGLWASSIAFGGGMAVLGVAAGLYIFTLPGYSTGALVGIYRLTGDVMQVGGPLVIGAVLDAFGFKISFTVMAIFGLLAMASVFPRLFARQPAS